MTLTMMWAAMMAMMAMMKDKDREHGNIVSRTGGITNGSG